MRGRSSTRRKKNTASSGGGFGISTNSKLNTKKTPAYIPDTSSTTRNLVKFLEEEECEGVGVEGGTEIGFCGKTGRRGLFAADDFQPGELMLGIPFPCCVTLAMDDIMIGEPSDPELGFRLLNLMSDTGNYNDFGPYFQSFPTRDEHFDATPDFWTVPEIKQLELPPILEKAAERKQEIEQLAQSRNVNEPELQFPTWLVKSRGFTLLKPMLTTPDKPASQQMEIHTESKDDTVEPQTTLVSKTVLMPYLDMINHDAPEGANAELQVLETKAEDESFYALQATRPIRKGSEIVVTYGTGQKSAVDMLSNYGFVPSRNPNDLKFMNENWSDHKWSTTLEEDKATLESTGDDASDAVMKKILDFRIRMKSSLA